MSDFDKDEQLQHPLLERHRGILEILIDERVFSVIKMEKGFYIFEFCDEYFSHELNKADCLELSKLFRELTEELEH